MVALLITPLIGKLALYIGAVDLPAHLRNRGDKTTERRIHDTITPKLAGLVLATPVILILLFNNGLHNIPWGVIAGGALMLVVGIIDDKFELSGKQQLAMQAVAAALVVLSGLSISFVQVGGIRLDFAQFSTSLGLDPLLIPGIITILWIVALINFIGWSDGVDGVHGALTIIATLTMWFIATRVEGLPSSILVLVALILGSNLGFYPYNLFPAKIFYAGSGTNVNGFFLAVGSILVTAKLETAVILLGLPIFDALLVIALRTKANPEVLKNPLKILAISDRNHLHHRLLDVGYSKPTVLLIELSLMLILCFIALFVSGLESATALPLVGSLTLVVIAFSVISIGKKKAERIKLQAELEEKSKPQIEVKFVEHKEDSNEKFTY